MRINGVRNGKQYVLEPSFEAGGVAYNEGKASESPADREASAWIDAIVNNKAPLVLPEEALVVTKILEGLYTSAKTGDIYRF